MNLRKDRADLRQTESGNWQNIVDTEPYCSPIEVKVLMLFAQLRASVFPIY